VNVWFAFVVIAGVEFFGIAVFVIFECGVICLLVINSFVVEFYIILY
jgi:hypothetical protein